MALTLRTCFRWTRPRRGKYFCDSRKRLPERSQVCGYVSLALLIFLAGASCRADESVTPRDADSEEPLSQQVEDPTARLTSLQFKDQYTPAEYGTDAQPNTFLIRPILALDPHGPLGLVQIVRPTFFLKTVPEKHGAATVTALGDTQLFDLFVAPWPNPQATRFRWGVGPYFIFPTASNDRAGNGAWQLGGATGFKYSGIPNLLLSGLVQQATSVGYTSATRAPVTSLTVQPIITYQVGHGWYLKSSDATWTFNLRHTTSTEIPLSAGVGKVWKFADAVAIHAAASGEWMAYRQFARQAEQFTLKFELTMLFPNLAL